VETFSTILDNKKPGKKPPRLICSSYIIQIWTSQALGSVINATRPTSCNLGQRKRSPHTKKANESPVQLYKALLPPLLLFLSHHSRRTKKYRQQTTIIPLPHHFTSPGTLRHHHFNTNLTSYAIAKASFNATFQDGFSTRPRRRARERPQAHPHPHPPSRPRINRRGIRRRSP
jgi:hypothetical protein